MRKISLLIVLTFLFLATYIGTASALFLPAPECGFGPGDNCLIFDDFTVYSLAFLQFNDNGDLTPGPGDPYYVDSAPGKIKKDIVIGTSPAAAKPNDDVVDGSSTYSNGEVDDAYDTPNSPPGGTSSALFAMTAPDPGADLWTGDNVQQPFTLLPNPDNLDVDGDGTGDGDLSGKLPLWDIQVNDLTTFLGGDDLAIFFNLNDSNAGGLTDGQDLLAWMTVYLTDSSTPTTSVAFTLSGANTLAPFQRQTQTTGIDTILPTSSDLWAYVHGQICVDNTNGAVIALTSCSDAGNPANGQTIDQALGANTAAFALWNEDLNSALYSGIYDTLSVDGRLAHIDNGYEQLFIRAAEVQTPIPEPSTFFLLGGGLAGLAFVIRRRRK